MALAQLGSPPRDARAGMPPMEWPNVTTSAVAMACSTCKQERRESRCLSCKVLFMRLWRGKHAFVMCSNCSARLPCRAWLGGDGRQVPAAAMSWHAPTHRLLHCPTLTGLPHAPRTPHTQCIVQRVPHTSAMHGPTRSALHAPCHTHLPSRHCPTHQDAAEPPSPPHAHPHALPTCMAALSLACF